MKQLILIGLLATFMLAGCVAADQQPSEAGSWQVDDNESTVPGCIPEAEPVWTTTEQEPWYVPERIQFSRNDGLFVLPEQWLGRTRVQRTHDGGTFGLPGYGRHQALDKSWNLNLETDQDDQITRVVRRSSGEALLELVPQREEAELATVEISASGRQVAAVTCAEGQSRLLRWSINDGDITHAEDIGPERERCQSWGAVGPTVSFGPAERTLVVVKGQTGELHHVDLTTGERTTARVELTTPDDEGETTRSWNQVVVDAHVGPNGRQLLLSTGDGLVEARRLPGLERVASFESSVEQLNEMTYALPVFASPVAWAPDGRRFASLSPEGDVVVRTMDGETLQSYPGAVAEPDEIWSMDDAAVALAFSHDGTRLAVGHYFGSAIYACENADFPRDAEAFDADVELSGPVQIDLEQQYEWKATLDGHAGAVGRFTIDGERVPARRAGVLTWRAYEPGTYELAVEFDDGRTSGRQTMTVVAE